MPNHNVTIGLCYPDFAGTKGESFSADEFADRYRAVNLCRLLRPQPSCLDHPTRPDILTDAASEWQRENWGCKWGTYDLQCVALKGDASPILLSFCSPWSSPVPMLPVIAKWMHDEHGVIVKRWIEGDPYDCTYRDHLHGDGT